MSHAAREMTSTLDHMKCPACDTDQIRDEKVYNGYPLKRCSQCGFVFTAQRNFSTDQYEEVYSGIASYQIMLNDAQQTYEGKKGLKDLWWFKRKALNWIHAHSPNGRLLDLGSGPGTLLMVAKRELGHDVQGIETAAAAAKVANAYGVPTYCGTVEAFAAERPEKFDAMTSFEVLEHVTDPLSFLSSARKLVKKDGVFVLSVPNLDDPYCLDQQIAVAMPPIHINFFSRKSLGRLLKRAGFDVRRTYTLPIPSSSVRNIHGENGLLKRIPYLAAMRLVGKADGTTLLTMAVPSEG